MSHKRIVRGSEDDEFLGKRQRLKSDEQCCQNCVDLKSYIDRKFSKLTAMLKAQNQAVLKALGVTHSIVKMETLHELTENDPSNVVSEEFPARLNLASIISMFPLQSEECLVNIDEQICEENEDLFVDAVKSIVCNELKKNFHSLLCKALVLDCNLDGTHGKTRFRDFKNFYNVLKQAIASDVDGPDPDTCIRKAFQYAKKFYYKQVSMQRSKLNASFSDPLRNL